MRSRAIAMGGSVILALVLGPGHAVSNTGAPVDVTQSAEIVRAGQTRVLVVGPTSSSGMSFRRGPWGTLSFFSRTIPGSSSGPTRR